MGEDEESTILTLTEYRNIISSLIEKYRGRVVDSPGDNLLDEFTSVVDAVQSSKETQRKIFKKNEKFQDNRKMEDLFNLQDEITKNVVLSLHIELTRGEAATIEARSTENIEAPDPIQFTIKLEPPFAYLHSDQTWMEVLKRRGSAD
jgi:hypothetical protein